jgi:hypothetical protein
MKVVPEMTIPIEGSCLCGQVTYRCMKQPVWSVNCHCRACQKLSGAPYVSAFSIPADSFELVGEIMEFRRRSDSGHWVTTSHCAACGSRIHTQSAGATKIRNIFASTLADSAQFRPVSNVYLSEAAPWIDPPHAMFNFAKMPEKSKRNRDI